MRAVRWTLGIFALFVAAGILFLFFGLNTLRAPIARAVTNATGRELVIEGNLRPAWDWIHPSFRAEKVTFANSPWAKPTRAKAGMGSHWGSKPSSNPAKKPSNDTWPPSGNVCASYDQLHKHN